ncbi:MAG: hypothetical protein V3T70_10950 [Phycisphaerae bacterium]
MIRQLGDPEFSRREAATAALIKLGEQAVDALLAHLNDPDPEIAARAGGIIPMPIDIDRRVNVACRLIETARFDLVEKGVWMLFEDAEAALERFRRAARTAGPVVTRAAPDIIDCMERWISTNRLFQQNLSRRAALPPERRFSDEKYRQLERNNEMIRTDLAQAAWLYTVAVIEEAGPSLKKRTTPTATQPAPSATQPND